MDNDTIIIDLITELNRMSEEYSKNNNDIQNYTTNLYYKHNIPERGIKMFEAVMNFSGYIVKLEFKTSMGTLIPKNTLDIKFMFEEGNLPVEYSIYELFNEIDKKNFNCYTIPYITNTNKMREAFEYLMMTFGKYKKRIEKLSKNKSAIDRLEETMRKEITDTYNGDIFKTTNPDYLMRMLDTFYMLSVTKFTSDTYLLYLKGKYIKAVKKYNSLKKPTFYEARLKEHIQQKVENKEKQVDEKVIPNNLRTLQEIRDLESNPTSHLIPMLVAWIAMSPIWFFAYTLLYYFVGIFLRKGTLYVAGADIMYLILPAFLTSIIQSYFLKKKIYKKIFKKKYEEVKEIDNLINGTGEETFMTKLLQFTIALSLVFTLLLTNCNIKFLPDGFIDNMRFLSIKGTYIEYTKVDKVYRVNSKINVFGKRVDNPSHVIVLKNGDMIDLYEIMMYEDTEKNIIPILEGKKIPIEEIDLIQDLEKK